MTTDVEPVSTVVDRTGDTAHNTISFENSGLDVELIQLICGCQPRRSSSYDKCFHFSSPFTKVCVLIFVTGGSTALPMCPEDFRTRTSVCRPIDRQFYRPACMIWTQPIRLGDAQHNLSS